MTKHQLFTHFIGLFRQKEERRDDKKEKEDDYVKHKTEAQKNDTHKIIEIRN